MKIFISAVSSQLEACRDALASDLRAVGAEVVVQEDFQQHSRSLLEKLEQHVASSDRIIALVGDAYGWEPTEAARPAGRPRRSYSQWEYYFAQGERLDGARQPARPTFVYFAAPEFLAQHPVAEDAEAGDRQRAFVAELRGSGKDYSVFTSGDELRAQVLRDGFRLVERRPQPRNLPFASLGRLFSGRGTLLTELRDCLQAGTRDDPQGVAVKVIHGVGGIGKTRLAIEYAWRHADDYRALLFVTADSPSSLFRNVLALTGPLVLNLPQDGGQEDEPRHAAALRWLEAHPGWLLILDNADTVAAAGAAEKLLARLRGGHVLITSRVADWSAAVESLELDILSDDAAIDFLLARTRARRRATPGDDAAAAALARELAGLPLALEQAGAYIAYRRCALADYLGAWRTNLAAVSEWFDARTMNYPHSLAATWQITLQQLRPGDVGLLRLFLWLAPDQIPRSLFEPVAATAIWASAAALVAEEQQRTANVESTIDDALATLLNFGLIKLTADGNAVSLHPVVQQVLRLQLPAAHRSGWFNHGWMLIVSNIGIDGLKDGAVLNGPLRVHLVALSLNADNEGFFEGEPGAAGGMEDMGSALAATGHMGEAEQVLRRAVTKTERQHGPDHVNVARCVRKLGLVLSYDEQPEEAELLVRRACAIHERACGIGSSEATEDREYLDLIRMQRDAATKGAIEQVLEKVGRRARIRLFFMNSGSALDT